MADCFGELFLLELDSADFFSERAIRFGSLQAKTPLSKSRALLCFVTSADQYFLDFGLAIYTPQATRLARSAKPAHDCVHPIGWMFYGTKQARQKVRTSESSTF